MCRGVRGAQPSVCSIPATWRSLWRRSRRSRLSTTSWWQRKSWRRKLHFWESWEKHLLSWKVSHAGALYFLCRKQLFTLVDSLLCVHQFLSENLESVSDLFSHKWVRWSLSVVRKFKVQLQLKAFNIQRPICLFMGPHLLCPLLSDADQFPGLQSKMRVVLRVEVEAVKFLKEEPHRLDALLKRCKTINDTLTTMRKYEL